MRNNKSSQHNFTLGYLSNGNINTQYLTGSYRSNFPDLKEIKSVYFYDKSNRLKKTEKYSTKYYALEGEYSFDADGNFLTHTRSFNGDNFNYDYYPFTNRLRKVTGTENQFTYDYNGNMTNDYLNENINISYDHRNLITEINRTNPLEDPPTEIKIRYRYDESGNRTRKTIYQSTIENPPPIPEEGDLPPGWIITKDEYFVRDAQGKEIAIYQGYELDFWNVFGMGNEGRIKSTGTNYFYLKDHLGSIRAVLNNSNYLVEAIDYDPWGFLARSWDTTATRYKFTGKERDNESTYDYFGARYYDARISNWNAPDPLMEKHLQWNPYNYTLRNPIILINPDGKQIYFSQDQDKREEQIRFLKSTVDPKYRSLISFTTDISGNYLFDIGLANEGMPRIVTDNNFTSLMTIANSSEPVSFEFMDYQKEFGYSNPENPSNNVGVSFKGLEAKSGVSIGGITFVSGNIDVDEKPTSLSENNPFSKIPKTTSVFINMKYGNEEAAVSLGHELYFHVFRYVLGSDWTDPKKRDLNCSKRNIIHEIEKQTRENYAK